MQQKNYEVVKKPLMIDQLQKVNNIDASGLVLMTKYDTDTSSLERKADIIGLVKNADCYSKITEIQRKIPSTIGLPTPAALTTIETKMPNVNNLVKKIDYDAEILDIKSSYFTTGD